jgi:hypothetical protein
MTTEYIVRVRNRAGVRQYDVTDFLSLEYSKYVNDVGLLSVDLPGNHAAIDALEKDGQIEIWRFDDAQGLDPYCDFYGLYRGRNRSTPSQQSKNGVFTLKAVSQLHFLKRAIIAFAAGTALRNDFTDDPAETVMRLMVQYNATSDATTTNDRIRTVGAWANNITIETDGGTGNNITKSFAHRNLLEALQEVATLGGIDFDLVKTGSRSWEFRTYALLGQDLSSNVKFSLVWDNLGNPSLTDNSLDEATVAIVGGENQGADRDFVVRTGPNYTADYNDIEIFVNAANQAAGSLEAAGDARLNELRSRDDFRFAVLQSAAYRYGRDYCIEGQMGDKVSVTYYEASVIKRLMGAHVKVAISSGGQSAESIQLDTVTAL